MALGQVVTLVQDKPCATQTVGNARSTEKRERGYLRGKSEQESLSSQQHRHIPNSNGRCCSSSLEDCVYGEKVSTKYTGQGITALRSDMKAVNAGSLPQQELQ